MFGFGLIRKLILAVMVTGVVAFGAGYYLSPDETIKGYRLGNEDGYSMGYNDGQNGVLPNPNRLMDDADYDLRISVGGRNRGE